MLDRELAQFHRTLGIPEDYEQHTKLTRHAVPESLVSIGEDIYGRPQRLSVEAATAWQEMRAAAERDSVVLLVVSAFRSPAYQVEVIQRQLDQGRVLGDILTVVAAPGFSEHHSGRALDLTTTGYESLAEEFENSFAFDWLSKEGNSYGFKMSYPRDNSYGVAYEPWHWCFHGDT